MRLGRTMLTYRGCVRWSVVVAVTAAVLLTGGALADVLLVPTGAAAGLVTVVWAVVTLRVIRLAPACPPPDGGRGPDGAGVREPRRPKPCPPGGAIALPLPGGPPDSAVLA